jgi:hypothetical protein
VGFELGLLAKSTTGFEIPSKELAKLDWVTAGRYEGENDFYVPQVILAAVGGNPQLRASGSTQSVDDFQLVCECRYVDEEGVHQAFPSEPIEDPSVLKELFLSFLNNDEEWKTLVQWSSY